MIFLSFVNLRVVKKGKQVKFIYKLCSDEKISSSLIKKHVPHRHYSKSLQGSKWAITMCPVSLESTLLLLLLI